MKRLKTSNFNSFSKVPLDVNGTISLKWLDGYMGQNKPKCSSADMMPFGYEGAWRLKEQWWCILCEDGKQL